MSRVSDESRRELLRWVPIIGAGWVSLACAAGVVAQEKHTGQGKEEKRRKEEGEKVTPGEDLMQEHGVLERILLIYEEGLRRMGGHKELPVEELGEAAGIIHSFIEGYHEKSEEMYLFPRFEKANQHVELVRTLKAQHDAGRKVTEQLQHLLKAGTTRNEEERRKLGELMRSFIRMYRPHKSREDTVLFPAFRDLVSLDEYRSLGEKMEHGEHELLGKNSFEVTVGKVAEIEKKLGIYDLAQFTPR